jgi:hypothetical protein
MDDRIRVSDADRDAAAAALREHYAAGRLTCDEMEERVSAALSAKTAGDLRRVLADLPGPAPVLPRAWDAGPSAHWGTPPWPGLPARPLYRRGPRLLPLVLAALVVAVVLPGAGWAFFALANLAMLAFLTACLAGIFMAFRFRGLVALSPPAARRRAAARPRSRP